MQLWLVKLFQRSPLNQFRCDELIYIDSLNSSNEENKQPDYKFDSGVNGKINNSETRFLTVNSDDDDDNESDEKILFNK